MAGRRWIPLLLALAATAQGCVFVPTQTSPPAKATLTAAPNGPRFKEMISAPGQTVAKADVQPATLPTGDLRPPLTQTGPPLAQTSAVEPKPLPDSPVVAAVRAYLDRRPDDAAEALRGLDPANREAVFRLLPALAAARSMKPGDAANYATLMATAADAAARAAPLRVRKACFVADVKQFGVYYPLPEDKRFLPGGEGQLYLELANVVPDPADHPRGGPGFVTRGECTMTITDAAGAVVSKHEPSSCDAMVVGEYTYSPVRDFFLKFTFRLPTTPGRYTLTVEFREQSSGRACRQTIGLVVGA